MALPWVFANLASGNQPASKFDDNFAALGAIAIIPCTAAGTNTILLTPVSGTPTVGAYNQLQAYRFVAAATTTGAATVNVSSIGGLATYKPSSSGPTTTGSGDIVIGECYDAIYDVALNSGAGGFHVYNVLAAGSGGSVVVQVVHTESGVVASGTTTIPLDDTIPQSSEGTQFITAAITPTNSSHLLRIDVTVFYANSSGTSANIVALFQDSTANALAAIADPDSGTQFVHSTSLTHWMTAGTTSATTFKVRIGGSAAGTITFNGGSGTSRLFGGVAASSITVTEYT